MLSWMLRNFALTENVSKEQDSRVWGSEPFIACRKFEEITSFVTTERLTDACTHLVGVLGVDNPPYIRL
jgi:hypothetical protein